jgi:hypothetical protein
VNLQGFHNRGEYAPPEWSAKLANYYWFIRVEGKRDKAKQRRYYRLVSKEKLRLAELNIDQELIEAVCKYLSSLTVVSGRRMNDLMVSAKPQMVIEFR